MTKTPKSGWRKILTNEQTVTITKKEYDELKDNSLWIQALEETGYDNWEWYGDALALYKKWKKWEGYGED